MYQPKILITGGEGFVGSHLVEQLLANTKAELHLTTYSAKESYVRQLVSPDQIHQLDLTDQAATFELIRTLQPDQIYHLAALSAVGSSFGRVKVVLENNTQLQLNLLEAVRQFQPQARILVIGSAMEYDLTHSYEDFSPKAITETYPLGPVSPYAISKSLQDFLGYSYAKSYQLDIIRVRPFNHIGERQNDEFVVPAFAKQLVAIERGEQQSLKVGNLEAIRDFTDVKDMVKAYQLLMEQGQTAEVYNIGSGQGQSIQQVLDLLIELSQAEVKIEQDQNRLRPSDVPIAIANPAKIKQLGWQPEIELKATLKRILDYWRSQPS